MRNSVKDIKYLMQSVRSVRYGEITLEITSIIHIYFNLVLTFLDLNGQEAARTSIGKIIIWGRYVDDANNFHGYRWCIAEMYSLKPASA